jgi:hypothetical protein
MNQREIRRAACRRAAGVIDTALAGGWSDLDELYGEDADKVRDQLVVLVKELERRG